MHHLRFLSYDVGTKLVEEVASVATVTVGKTISYSDLYNLP